MATDKKRLNIKPLWVIGVGIVLIVLSYLIDSSVWWLIRTLQIVGIMLVILGVIIGSARLNSKRQL